MARKAHVPGITPGDGDPRHGTENGYQNLHCSCERCRDAHAEYMRKRRNKNILVLHPLDSRHGTYSYYVDFNCRCVPCTLSMRVHRHRRYDYTAAISNHVVTVGLVERDAAPVSILRHRFPVGQAHLADDRDWVVSMLIPAELSALARVESTFKSMRSGEYQASIAARDAARIVVNGKPRLAPDDERHGTQHAYRYYSCRCDRCRKAHLDALKKTKENAAAEVLQTARLLASGVLKIPPRTWLEKA